MSRYAIVITATGCETLGNPSRCENGQPAEEITVDGRLVDAILATPFGRTATIYDQWGDVVAECRYGRWYDADGDEMLDMESV